MVRVTPCLMFDGNAAEAIALYLEAFPEAVLLEKSDYGADAKSMSGKVRSATLAIYGNNIRIIDSPVMHGFAFTPAVSLYIELADEAAQAYADPVAFLAANPDINYDDSFPIPLGEWVVVGSLPDTVLFQADTYGDLFAQIVASFGPGVAFNLKPKQLAKTEDLTALNRIQIQMSALSPEDGGYVLLNFSQPLDDEIQAVLVFGNDLPRVLALCADVGIKAEPSLEALKVAVHV